MGDNHMEEHVKEYVEEPVEEHLDEHMEWNQQENVELCDINEYVEFLKSQMEVLSAAFEEFDLDTYLVCVQAIHFQSSVFKQEKLRDFCAGYMKLIETYEFEGVYAKIQELVDLVTETINTLETIF